jgi:hypothetical protein
MALDEAPGCHGTRDRSFKKRASYGPHPTQGHPGRLPQCHPERCRDELSEAAALGGSFFAPNFSQVAFLSKNMDREGPGLNLTFSGSIILSSPDSDRRAPNRLFSRTKKGRSGELRPSRLGKIKDERLEKDPQPGSYPAVFGPITKLIKGRSALEEKLKIRSFGLVSNREADLQD